jgi:hypothetical protein
MQKMLRLFLAMFICCIQAKYLDPRSYPVTFSAATNQIATSGYEAKFNSQTYLWSASSLTHNMNDPISRIHIVNGVYRDFTNDLEYKIWLPLLEKPSIFYVATTGSDANPGTKTQPWRTIQKAANTLMAGEYVLVMAGSYEEVVTEDSSGLSTSSMIHFVADGMVTVKGFNLMGNYIEIRGFSVTAGDCSWHGAIIVSGSNDRVEGNTVQDSGRQGIEVSYTATNSTIRGNTIRRVLLNGLFVAGTKNTVENNDISDIRDHIGSCTNRDTNGIEFHGTGHIIRGNYIHDLLVSNQSERPHMDAFQTFSGSLPYYPAAKDVIIERNHVFLGNTTTGLLEEPWSVTPSMPINGFMISGITSDKSDGLIIRNNLIEAIGGFNIGNTGNVSNLKIFNNTFRGSLSFPQNSSGSVGIMIDIGVVGYEIYNNILVNFSNAAIFVENSTCSGTGDFNLLWNSDSSIPRLDGYILGSHDLRAVNPRFVSNFTDFHLQSSSPAIDTGRNLGSVNPDDFDGTIRPKGEGYDIGAYELPTP